MPSTSGSRSTFVPESPWAAKQERDLVSLFQDVAEHYADRLALTTSSRTLTYRELDEWSNSVARLLRGKGIVSGSRVALRVSPSAEAIAAILGILKCGAAYIPLDIRNPASRTAFILADSECTAIVGDSVTEFDDITAVTSAHIASLAGEGPTPPVGTPPAAADPAYFIYTSGTTGNPKGVGVSHGNVTALLAGASTVFDFSHTDRWLLFHSLAFDFSVWEMWGAFSAGGTLVILPHWAARSPEQCLKVIEAEHVTVVNQTPTAFAPLAQAALRAPSCDLSHLRYVIFGGEKLLPAMIRPWAKRFGLHQPRLVNGYGITETTVFTTFHILEEADLACEESIIGVPVPGFSARVVSEDGTDARDSETGELWLAGPQVAQGYLNRPELDSVRFPAVPDPATGISTRYYRSGDLVSRTVNGEFRYHGRADLQVKLRGYRIELSDIEAAVRRHEQVVDAVVSAREYNTGDVRLTCTYVAREGKTLEPRELREHVKGLLPSYMWPAHYRSTPSLPRTINGKIDRAMVAQLWRQGEVDDRTHASGL